VRKVNYYYLRYNVIETQSENIVTRHSSMIVIAESSPSNVTGCVEPRASSAMIAIDKRAIIK